MAFGLPDRDLECVVALTLAIFFGWHAISVFSVQFTLVKRSPDELGHPMIKFGNLSSRYPPFSLWDVSITGATWVVQGGSHLHGGTQGAAGVKVFVWASGVGQGAGHSAVDRLCT